MERGHEPRGSERPFVQIETELVLIVSRIGPNKAITPEKVRRELSPFALNYLKRELDNNELKAVEIFLQFASATHILVRGRRPNTYRLGPRGETLFERYFSK